MSHSVIDGNLYSKRIEFRLTKYNCDYRSIHNISGVYNEIMTRYTPYLAVLYHGFFYGNVIVDAAKHPYFDIIYKLAALERTRYTGSLEIFSVHIPSPDENLFYAFLRSKKMANEGLSTEMMVHAALNGNKTSFLQTP